ncbi:MAG: DNA/RNA non-specific endonuclease [Gammaproteobacteria bacterium]|nr:DNA/RNA non-specific endonuclease [Gammaproteobacteria bacterium]
MRLIITNKLYKAVLLASTVCTLFLSPVLHAQSVAIAHCQGICPSYTSSLSATRANVVVHNLYAAGLNGDTGMADWVAYRLTKEAIGVASLLPRFWQPDELVRLSGIGELAEAAALGFSLAEISGAGSPYGGLNEPLANAEERVRLAPMTSFAKAPYWRELNNLSNMVSMPAPLRRGAWLQLEQTLNQIVSEENSLGVISGPLYLIDGPLSTVMNNTNLNPAAYFKVVVADSGIAAFVFTHDVSQADRFCEHQADLGQIELMSGLDLFPERNPVLSAQLLSELGCS